MGESISEFMKRRWREVHDFGQTAVDATHDEYQKALRSGRNLNLPYPADVIQYGLAFLGPRAPTSRRSLDRSSVRSKPQKPTTSVANRSEDGAVAKRFAGEAARKAGNLAGMVRGGLHTVEGLAEGAEFLYRLSDPLDMLRSEPGQSALDQLVAAGRNTAGYAQKGWNDPRSVVNDVKAKLHQARIDLDPKATPVAPTIAGEIRRNFDIGQNQGEFAFDVGSLIVGGPAAKAVKGFGEVSNVGKVEKYLAQGFSPRAAAHLAEPYPASNLGHHFVPRRTKLPGFLGGGPLPRSYLDGPFNKLSPPNISRGDFYELHYKVDPRFYGTAVRGERWSGRDLSLKKHGPVGRLWFGSPAPLKARVGGLTAGSGAGLYSANER